MLRYDRVSPIELPGIGRWLGPIRTQFFLGRLSGQQFVHVGSQTLGQPGVALSDQPFINGQKFSFKPKPSLEFSVSRTTIFAGAGAPFTTQEFSAQLIFLQQFRRQDDPGDRRSDVDVQYTIPKLHDLLKIYVDTFTDDEPFPVTYPTDSAWSPGFYVARLPHLPHVDFRGEGYLTPRRTNFPGFYYFNVHYLSGYTNERQLLGSWIGRESNGYQLWSTWWLSPRSSVQLRARDQNASSVFLRGGSLPRPGNQYRSCSKPTLAAKCGRATGTVAISAVFRGSAQQSDHDHPALLPPESRRILMATAEIIATMRQPDATHAELGKECQPALASSTHVGQGGRNGSDSERGHRFPYPKALRVRRPSYASRNSPPRAPPCWRRWPATLSADWLDSVISRACWAEELERSVHRSSP